MLKDLLVDIIGDYVPQVVVNTTGSAFCSSWDWEWIGSWALLVVFIYCFLRALGGVLRGK